MIHGSNRELLVRYETEYFYLGRDYIEVGVEFFKNNMVRIKNGKNSLSKTKRVPENFFIDNNLVVGGHPNYKLVTEDLPKILKKSSFLNIPDWDDSKKVQAWERITASLDGQYKQKKWEPPLKPTLQSPRLTLIIEAANVINDHWEDI